MREQPNIGRAEMDVLQYVTEHHPVTVREVADHIAKTKGHVRTTVLNVMERLRKKRFLKRSRVKGLYQYSPVVAKTDLHRNLIREFVQRTLGGSVTPFVSFLVEEASMSNRELLELKKLVRDLEQKEEK